jgi:beta-mannosidase
VPADLRLLRDGWEVASTPPDACRDPAAAAGLDWRPASGERGPGPGGGLTAARASGESARLPSGRDLDAEDWWFRIAVGEAPPAEGEELVLHLRGLATVAAVWVDGRHVLSSDSMYSAYEVPIPGGVRELVICCRALTPRLAVRRGPRARWRTRVVGEGNLRFFRTMLLGRAPGFAPGPAVVGPWRGVAVDRRGGVVCETAAFRPRLEAGGGRLPVAGRLRAIPPARLPERVRVSVGTVATELPLAHDGEFAGEVVLPGARPWWPHTHGDPVLHPVVIEAGDEPLHRARVGFRTLTSAMDLVADGPALVVNGVPVFCRGALWTPSLLDPHGDEAALRAPLEALVRAGGNMVRVPGPACYGSAAFHDLCDELGLLVWQDLMFANFDYPESDAGFMAEVEAEVATELATLAGRPSLAVVCGGSEVAQQVAMLGLDPGLANGPLYGELLPRLVAEAGIEAPYLPSAPWGGSRPFRTDRGVTNYFGVGAYLRDLGDPRRAAVRFASECLAFANVGDGPPPGDGAVLGAAWKRGVPRDTGAGWDFDDVRDHYLQTLWGIDPTALRYADPARYLALSRQLTGEIMAATFGEWRRPGSSCRGGLVLWLQDLVDGAGWGLIDAAGAPKAALAVLARVLAPRAVWMTDEGLNGIAVHVANDRPGPLRTRLRLALYRDGATRVQEASRPLNLPGHSACTLDAEDVMGRFLDLGWSYRFGPPSGDAIVASLLDDAAAVIAQTFLFPLGPPLSRQSSAEIGLQATLALDGPERALLTLVAKRLAYGVRIAVPGWRPQDDAFALEPGQPRTIALTRGPDAETPPVGSVAALNAAAPVRITIEG